MVFSTGSGVDLQNKQAMGKVGGSAIRIAKSHILGRSGEPFILPTDEEVLYCLQMRRSQDRKSVV